MNRRRARLPAAIGVLAWLAAAGAAAPPASADDGDTLGVALAPGNGPGPGVGADGAWYWRGDSMFDFTVTVTDISARRNHDATVQVSIPIGWDGYGPPIGADIRGYEGDDWTCVDTDPGVVSCTNPDVVVPGESFPTLTLHYYPDCAGGPIDATGTDGAWRAGHDTVQVVTDCSL